MKNPNEFDSIQEFKTYVKELIAEDISAAFQALKPIVEHHARLDNTWILLKGSYNDTKELVNKNIVDKDGGDRARNNLRSSLLELVDQLKDSDLQRWRKELQIKLRNSQNPGRARRKRRPVLWLSMILGTAFLSSWLILFPENLEKPIQMTQSLMDIYDSPSSSLEDIEPGKNSSSEHQVIDSEGNVVTESAKIEEAEPPSKDQKSSTPSDEVPKTRASVPSK